MFPDMIPTIVQRIFCAKDLFYKQKPFATKFTREDCSAYLEEDFGRPEWAGLASSLATIDRARKDFPKLLPWPLFRWTRRPWEEQPELLVLKPEDAPIALHWEAFDEQGNQHTVEAVSDENGLYRIVTRLPTTIASVLAAGFAAFVMLDGLDGHYDQAIHWCRVFADVVDHVRF